MPRVGAHRGLRIVEPDRQVESSCSYWNPVALGLAFRQRDHKRSVGPTSDRIHRDRITIGRVRYQEIVGTVDRDAPPARRWVAPLELVDAMTLQRVAVLVISRGVIHCLLAVGRAQA